MGFGCGALFLVVLIGGIVAVRTVKRVSKAAADGIAIQQAIVRYQQQRGAYPPMLITLIQDGSLDGKLLHNDLDDSPNPGHVSWRYTRPAQGAPGETPILAEPYHLTVAGSSLPGKIVIPLDGRR